MHSPPESATSRLGLEQRSGGGQIMERPSADNPLSLPRDDEGGVHQLWLKQLEGIGYKSRADTCNDVMRFLATIPEIHGVVEFNSLTLPLQIVAILITEEAQSTHQQLECFLQAPAESRQLALLNSAHRWENDCLLFHEVQLGHITNFLRNQEGIGFRERVGKLPVGMGGGRSTKICSLENPLGLPMDDQGHAHQLRVEII